MWWAAVLIPVVVLAIAIVVAPVAVGSVRSHRWHTRRVPRRPVQTGLSLPPRPRRVRRLRCPLCLPALNGETTNQPIIARNEHVLDAHVTSETPSSTVVGAQGGSGAVAMMGIA